MIAAANPFASRFVRPGTMPFHFPSGVTSATLAGRLQAAGWRGAIVGPHGSGKSTLLATLVPALLDLGRRPLLVTLRDQQRRLPVDTWRHWADADLLIIDGYEQLGHWHRFRVQRQCRRRGSGLLVTSHHAVSLPILWHTEVSSATARCIVERLTAQSVDEQRLAHDLQRHAGNFRSVLFELYDEYEQGRARVTSAR